MTDKDDFLGLGINLLGGAFVSGDSTLPEYSRLQEAALRNLDGYRRIDAHAAVMTEDDKQRRKACPNKPLTKPPGHYLTGYEGSPCKPIKDYDLDLAPFKWQTQGIDTDEFKKQCEDIDKGES